MKQQRKPAGQAVLILTVIMLASNLRLSITGVGSLASFIRADLGISNTVMGVLTAIPMVVFAIVSLLASPLAARLGLGRTIFAGLWFILGGILVRSFTTAAGLFLGTALLSVGIGLLSVLCVALMKQRSAPKQLGAVTSAYTTTMSLGATVSIAASVPLAHLLGWRGALAVFGLVTAVSLAVWGPQCGRPENQTPPAVPGEGGGIRRMVRSPLAWELTIFTGAQALLFYCINAWWPTILQSRGFSVDEAALAATLLQAVSIPSTFLVPLLCGRFRPMWVLVGFNAAYLAGMLLFFFAATPQMHYFAILWLAVGMGSSISFYNLFYNLRTRSAAEASALSGMSLAVGNLMAAVGPILMGALFDALGSWTPPLLFLLAALGVTIVFSQLSARERFID